MRPVSVQSPFREELAQFQNHVGIAIGCHGAARVNDLMIEIPIPTRIGEDVQAFARDIDDPVFANTEFCKESGSLSQIVGKAGIGYLD